MAGTLAVAALLGGCAHDRERPEVASTFLTADVYHVRVLGDEFARPPELRALFIGEVEATAVSSGCDGYDVMREWFTSTASINFASWAYPSPPFGRYPLYEGIVQCRLVPPLATARPGL